MCYNENLKSYVDLNMEVMGLMLNIPRFLNEIAEIEIPPNADEYFFNETLLNKAYDNLSQKEIYYDHIVIDEFQDLAKGTLIF